ncbi:MAG: rod shape-determining protein [Clostridia bacterium]|nr:rod shape-determining protein [Clostridia bacterium]MDY3785581.1 rod shape-determining protein [Eubacteriales bacterium]
MGKQIGIDLGTANTLIYQKGRGIVLRSPSVVAIDRVTGQLIATGLRAKQMLGKTPTNIIAYKPLKDGVIADIDVTTLMLNDFMRKCDLISTFNRPSILVCVPQGVTTVERRAVENAAYDAGARTVATMLEPMAAAIGSGLQVASRQGSMIVDIGGGTTEVAIISCGGIVASSSLRIAGDEFDNAIVKYIKAEYGVLIADVTAEQIKRQIGSVHPSVDLGKAEVVGRDMSNGLVAKIQVSSADVRAALAEQINQIVAAIMGTLGDAPPELSSDIYNYGIMLSGGGSLLGGLDLVIHERTTVRVTRSKRPLDAVCIGVGRALDNEYTMKEIINYRYK